MDFGLAGQYVARLAGQYGARSSRFVGLVGEYGTRVCPSV